MVEESSRMLQDQGIRTSQLRMLFYSLLDLVESKAFWALTGGS